MIKRKGLLILLPSGAVLSIIIFIFLNLPADPDKTELELYFRAVNSYENADFDLCITLTEALAKGNPEFYQAKLLKAKAEFFSDCFADAADTLRKLLKNRKNYYEAEIWLMRCHFQLEDTGTAIILGEDLLSRAPEDPRVLGMLARIAASENDYQKAIEYYNRSVLFEEELAINRIELAKIYCCLLNPEKAAVNLEKAVGLLAEESPLKPAVISLIEKMETY